MFVTAIAATLVMTSAQAAEAAGIPEDAPCTPSLFRACAQVAVRVKGDVPVEIRLARGDTVTVDPGERVVLVFEPDEGAFCGVKDNRWLQVEHRGVSHVRRLSIGPFSWEYSFNPTEFEASLAPPLATLEVQPLGEADDDYLVLENGAVRSFLVVMPDGEEQRLDGHGFRRLEL